MEEPAFNPNQFCVIFDQDCPLCRNLAAFAEARGQGLKFMSYCDFEKTLTDLPDVLENLNREKLMVWDGESLSIGTDAWARMIDHSPDLKGLSWLAAKLGLGQPMARLFEVSGLLLRGFCKKCPHEMSAKEVAKNVSR